MHASRCQAQSGMSWDAAIAARAAANVSDVSDAEGPTPARSRCRDDDGGAEPSRSAERRHPLVQAMTEALRSLMPADAKPSDSAEVKDSAAAFAHELVDALRTSGGRQPGWQGGHCGYDDLAQRLDALAAKLEQPTAAPAAQPAAAGGASSLSASLTTTSLSLGIDASGTSASLSVTSIELQVSAQGATAAKATDAAPTKTESPLLAAFRKMMVALQPAGSSTTTPASDASDASKLSGFLRQLASALRGSDATGSDTAATPATTSGSLLSLAA